MTSALCVCQGVSRAYSFFALRRRKIITTRRLAWCGTDKRVSERSLPHKVRTDAHDLERHEFPFRLPDRHIFAGAKYVVAEAKAHVLFVEPRAGAEFEAPGRAATPARAMY